MGASNARIKHHASRFFSALASTSFWLFQPCIGWGKYQAEKDGRIGNHCL
jgi:hypothetical protein